MDDRILKLLEVCIMPPETDKGIFAAGREMGALTEAVRTLQTRFGDFERHIGKRCTDCAISEGLKKVRVDMDDHEKRIRWVERKMYGAIAITGIIVYLVDKVKIP